MHRSLNLFLSLLLIIALINVTYSQNYINPTHKVTLREAHLGTLEVDTRILNSYHAASKNINSFYKKAHAVLSDNEAAAFTDKKIVQSALEHDIKLLGGAMLGDVTSNSVALWLRPYLAATLQVKVSQGTKEAGLISLNDITPGKSYHLSIDGLEANTRYGYSVYSGSSLISQGSFRTMPDKDNGEPFRITFGSCSHKVGLHNPNIIRQIVSRSPQMMVLLGDIAVDDRDNQINLHRADYLLRDLSDPWQTLISQVPIYAAWDDHDYLNNDLAGIPEPFTAEDRTALRKVWQENWNNPAAVAEGLQFNTRVGPVELIVLDTRSYRNVEARGERGSYLGEEQMQWLQKVLKESTAPFKVISSGTMWSDYVTKGKDSWGTWDTLAREDLFQFIEKEQIHGVIFISGDRHGARGFKMPRPSGHVFYEFEAATLGGVPGPDAMAPDTTSQLFGYHGSDIIAFGELTFENSGNEKSVTFRLIDELGNIREEHTMDYSEFIPGK